MIEIIVAVSLNNAIGKDNKLLMPLPSDLKRFSDITTGHTVVMGRKTWESLPDKARPLPKRFNVVLTRNPDYQAAGADDVLQSLDDVLEHHGYKRRLFVIGGADVYQQALSYASIIHMTRIHQEISGDSFFPVIDDGEWRLVAESEKHYHNGVPFSYQTFMRI